MLTLRPPMGSALKQTPYSMHAFSTYIQYTGNYSSMGWMHTMTLKHIEKKTWKACPLPEDRDSTEPVSLALSLAPTSIPGFCGMCVKSALKKLYSYSRNTRRKTEWLVISTVLIKLYETLQYWLAGYLCEYVYSYTLKEQRLIRRRSPRGNNSHQSYFHLCGNVFSWAKNTAPFPS